MSNQRRIKSKKDSRAKQRKTASLGITAGKAMEAIAGTLEKYRTQPKWDTETLNAVEEGAKLLVTMGLSFEQDLSKQGKKPNGYVVFMQESGLLQLRLVDELRKAGTLPEPKNVTTDLPE